MLSATITKQKTLIVKKKKKSMEKVRLSNGAPRFYVGGTSSFKFNFKYIDITFKSYNIVKVSITSLRAYPKFHAKHTTLYKIKILDH